MQKYLPILKLDANGLPVKWIGWQEAVIMHWNKKVLWSVGKSIDIPAGTNIHGVQSHFSLPTIVACKDGFHSKKTKTPPLKNTELFRRDGHRCGYCRKEFPSKKLTRDHVIPSSRGGKDTWTNVVTCCKRCNNHKANMTPDEAGMVLNARPTAPSRQQWLLLKNPSANDEQRAYLKGETV